MRKVLLLLGLAAIGGCSEVLGYATDVSAVVRVVDERGDPLRADEVVWYYDPQSARYDGEHPAQCINAGCTRWGVPTEAAGAVYVSASWRRPTSQGCTYNGYDAGLLTASEDDPPTVTLRLDTRLESCA